MEITNCNKTFGTFIKEGRRKQGLYQADVAKELGITQVYYSHIERGERNVDLSLALRICHALHLNINDFVDTQKPPVVK